MKREENAEASDDNEGVGGEAENGYDVKHIANANGDDADDEISDKKYRIRMRNVSTGGEGEERVYCF